MLLLDLQRGQVVPPAAQPGSVVIAAPRFDDNMGFGTRAKLSEQHALVAEFAVEALVGAVVSRLARIDQRSADAGLGQPLQDRPADEFGTIVRT
jgi:hypothetical protein